MSLSSKVSGLDADMQHALQGQGDVVLMWVCLVVAAVFVVLAVLPARYRLLKLGAICWAVLP